MTAADKIVEARALLEVKPLEWTRKGPGHWASGRYTVLACQSRHWFVNGDHGLYHEADTCEAVKEAANAHHRAWVLSQVTIRADLADAQAQEIAKLRSALAGLANALELPAQRGVLTLVPEALDRARAAIGETP